MTQKTFFLVLQTFLINIHIYIKLLKLEDLRGAGELNSITLCGGAGDGAGEGLLFVL